ncbi:hypothetical protein PROFUN_04472 [Planoprotostelium fungivorum]|uniref:DNA topoisomerase 2 n=1 Tax=Planoprotostelium fungivorum TaxID=1890364 RepID=A0A2P6NVQ0_9EUKA|nr:hypothetical protein PROFUN_04472 [Planoprotostelium fungivorum]
MKLGHNTLVSTLHYSISLEGAPLYSHIVITRGKSTTGPLLLSSISFICHNTFSAKGITTSVESTYQRKTPVEHVLLRPDTYIGGVDSIEMGVWLAPLSTKEKLPISWTESAQYPPGLFKIFDEVLVNAADNRQRDSSMQNIHVEIDSKKGIISVFNDGRGIPVQKHKTENLYVPELIFGNLFTGSNFDDQQAKVTGGRNGYGAKLANIFSKKFTVQTCANGLSYTQSWSENMSVKGEPIIEEAKGAAEWTKITFQPDLEKFKMQSLNEGDILGVMARRVYDIAGSNEGLTVKLNGQTLPSGFSAYLSLYNWSSQTKSSGESSEISIPAITKINARWQVGVEVSQTGTFNQISFVNSINTSRGGTHVNYVTDQVVRYLSDELRKKDKEFRYSPAQIKNHLNVYINCLVENPAFDSQTKETLTTRASVFGSKCHLSERWLSDMAQRTGIVDEILNWARMKQQSELSAKSGRMSSKIVGIPKLYDANLAGTPRSNECTLIITEGDSAKALAVSGLSVVGRDTYGVFPLRGKLLNVAEATHAQLMGNVEVANLVTILGLNYEKEYGKRVDRDLRYGRVMLMTDQDHDGSHIKGLVINLFHHFWPSLLKTDDFLEEFITPIIKATKGKNKKVFFTLPEYSKWYNSTAEAPSWTSKYYKGLGTNTAEEAKEYFKNIDQHRIPFRWTEDSSNLIEMAFHKEHVGDRKNWLLKFRDDGETFVDHGKLSGGLKYSEFIDKELILFSHADLVRSIPSIMDGLKPGQRKVLHACFKRNLKQEIKVAQLAGYVAENTAYHHGEASLHSTIINMAQDFVGSNNVPLLFPSGQFGSRLQGGKDAASARYLFTRLNKLTRQLFPEEDDELLQYREEEGQTIEPKYFLPILPTILINGAQGVGTGWSTFIPCFSPQEVAQNLLRKMNGESMVNMVPSYNGFKGNIQQKTPSSFLSSGVFEKVDPSTMNVKELPIGVWVDDYKEHLDELIKNKVSGGVRSYTMQHTSGNSAEFSIKFGKNQLELAEKAGTLSKKLRLDTSISVNNMHLFDDKGVLTRFETPLQIIDLYFPVRLEFYQKRMDHQMVRLEKEVEILSNKTRFYQMVADGSLKIGGRSKPELISQLRAQNFVPTGEKPEDGFDYLLNVPIYSLTSERMNKSEKDKEGREKELRRLKKSTPTQIWKAELQELMDNIEKNTVV